MYYSVAAIKGNYHPNAYLQRVRNVKGGLVARTKLLSLLEAQPDTTVDSATKTGMSYEAALHHLRLLESEGTVSRRGKRPCVWMLTGLGQKRLA